MMSVFSKDSLVVLESFSFTKTLYAFDFDGTLAKIVNDPEAAKMSEKTEVLVKQLASIVPVAIVSGRSQKDLKKRISFKVDYLIGNHGMEGVKINNSLNAAKDISNKWISLIKKMTVGMDLEIEDKTYSLAIHYRKSRNKTRSRVQIKEIIESIKPKPRVVLGKCVVNIIPEGAPHKGTALVDLLHKLNLKNAFYIGDDDTDEDVFSYPIQDCQIFSVKVGKRRNTSADYYIQRQSDINRLLKILINFHDTVKIGKISRELF